MRKQHKALSIVVSLAMTCSLMPVSGMAYAVDDTASGVEDVKTADDANTHDDGGTPNETISDAASAETGDPKTDETSSSENVVSLEERQTDDAQANATESTDAISGEQGLDNADQVTSDGSTDSADEEAAKSPDEDHAKVEEEIRGEDGADLLSDEELDALAVELDKSDVFELSEGDIALRAQAATGWSRVWGKTALDTMQRVLQIGTFPSGRGGDVIVTTADGYWDALSAAGLAGTLRAPIVLTSATSLSSQAKSEIARLRPNRLIVMGGPVAVTDSVLSSLKKLAPTVVRAWGQQSWDTAVEGYRMGKDWGNTCIVATSHGYWDALSAAPYAYWGKCPIFLTDNRDCLSQSVLSSIRDGGISRVVIVGGRIAVSPSVEGQLSGIGVKNVKRVCGDTALDTSAAFAQFAVKEGMKLTNLTVATSDGYWDALSAAPVCGELESVLVLVSSNGDYRALDAVYNYAPGSVEHGYIIGGPVAIPETIERRVTADWAIKSINVSTSSMRPGGSVTVTPELITGGPSASTFSYNYIWSGGGTSGSTGSAKGATSRKLTLSNPGIYDVGVEVTGPDGMKQKMTTKVYVYSLKGISVSANNRHSWKLTADIGLSGNGASGVEFRFTWKRNGSSASGVIRDWSSSPTADIDVKQMQGSAYDYTVTVEARDRQGSLGSKSAGITPRRALDIEWAGQPNNYYCGPTAGFMILRNAGAWNSRADGSSLTIGNVAGAMGTSYYGYTSFTDRMFERGMNSWLGSNVYTTIDNPSYDTVRAAIFRSFDTGYAVAFDAHEVSGGWHYNGHNDATFSHILVVDAYNPDNDTVLLVDPGAGVLWGGASQKFWYSLRDFVNIYLAPAYWRDGIGMICPR